ncbi:MAG: IS66 family transposase [Bacilli bacterium]
MEEIKFTREKILELFVTEPEMMTDLFLSLIQRVEGLTQRVHELERQLNQNSRNSSKPPSSDGYKKPNPQSLRGKSGKPSGGQPGHKGHHLAVTDNPDHIVTHSPSSCQKCGRSLDGVRVESYDRRQVRELVVRFETSEHRAEILCCPDCRHRNQAPFPADVPFQVQYGPALKSFLSYGSIYQLIPFERLTELLFDLTGHSVSEGTLYNTNQMLYGQLDSYETSVKEQLLAAPVVHFDESGLRVKGKTHWLHSASNHELTYYTAHQKRGQDGMDAAGILPEYNGVAVHDGWSSYWGYPCQHALCNIHHERELKAVVENDKQTWASDLTQLLHQMNHAVRAATALEHDRLTDVQISDFESTYAEIIQRGLAENPLAPRPDTRKRGRVKKSKTRNLLERLDQNREAVLLFIRDFRVPYTNNQAEQDVRMIKVHQKVSGTFRSTEGAKIFCRIRGYLSTLKKQGLPVLEYLQHAIRGTPFIPPSLES